MKCDLHVHSIHSGMCTVPVLKHVCRESYNDPREVYSVLKGKGMDLVTLTDHDSIGGAEVLRGYADFFLSEEVTCRMPTGTTVHVGVFDITERQHIEIQRRRDDFVCLLAVAASIAVSRIIVGMHFLTDIVVGALMGALIGYLSVWLFL